MTLAKGRLTPAPPEIAAIRPISRDDLPRLAKPRDASAGTPARLRESHHTVARLFAADMTQKQVAELTGYSGTRINQLHNSPAMKELISNYRLSVDRNLTETIDAFATLAMKNMIAAERQIADTIAEADDADELLPLRELRAISSDRADRFGYGKKTTNVNVNVDFAARLEQAIQRSSAAKQIEGQVIPPPTGPASRPGRDLHPAPSPVPIRRIA